MSVETDFDPWTQVRPPDGLSKPSVATSEIGEIEPLDTQFGVDVLKTVPEPLHDPLFGVTSDERTAGTYAILDAAAVTNLPELLETSGLDHECLFRGEALEEFASVAPWIVQMEDGHPLTRNLFTRSDALWHLWDDAPGIFVRSHRSLELLASHFRKFTKLQGTDGRWRYFRFWEPMVCQAYLSAEDNREGLSPFFFGHEGPVLESVICCPVPGPATVHRVIVPSDTLDGHRANKLDRAKEQAIADAMRRRRQSEISVALRKTFPDQTSNLRGDELDALVGRVATKLGQWKIHSVRHIHVFAAWQLFYGPDFEAKDPDRYAERLLSSEIDEEQKLVKLRKRLDDLHSAGWL